MYSKRPREMSDMRIINEKQTHYTIPVNNDKINLDRIYITQLLRHWTHLLIKLKIIFFINWLNLSRTVQLFC